MRKILIVGAGPAGIFTALELVRNGSNDEITIIEQGRLIENRVCPKNKTKDCIHCKPYCNITSGFSGAGAFSDGKLSLNREVGGDFPSLVGEDFLKSCIPTADKAKSILSPISFLSALSNLITLLYQSTMPTSTLEKSSATSLVFTLALCIGIRCSPP